LAASSSELEPEELVGHESEINHVCFSNNGEMFATCGKDAFVCVWDATCENLNLLKIYSLLIVPLFFCFKQILANYSFTMITAISIGKVLNIASSTIMILC